MTFLPANGPPTAKSGRVHIPYVSIDWTPEVLFGQILAYMCLILQFLASLTIPKVRQHHSDGIGYEMVQSILTIGQPGETVVGSVVFESAVLRP